jgi:circadian clock protein KaiC
MAFLGSVGRDRSGEPGRSGRGVQKAATGIEGLDEITFGGLPRGRTSLVCGGPGSGKTMLGLEFLVRGVERFDEPGVFIAFEETPDELRTNGRSLGFDVAKLEAEGKLYIDHIHLDRSEIEAAGEYDLEGLFLRIGLAVEAVGARRVVLDTLEALFAGLPDEFTVRAELRRLFRWLKDRDLTAIVTAERGDGTLTRYGLEEYVSDFVMLLDHRVVEQVSTRRLRIVKYRGSRHGTNEYPFLMSEHGFSVLPLTSATLDQSASTERISSGVPALDEMLGGKGFYRGTSILLSGTAGTGKSSLAAHFTDAACRRGERVLYLAFEESPAQIVRNMRSIGIDLQPWMDEGLLNVQSERPTAYGLEVHLARIHAEIRRFDPHVVVIDPITNFYTVGTGTEVHATLTRLVDMLKSRGITALFTSLTSPDSASLELTNTGVSSVIDSWLLVRELEQHGERNRALYILKARGIAHSNQVREFQLTDHGARLVDVFVTPEGVLTGSARDAHVSRARLAHELEDQQIERRERALARRRRLVASQIAALEEELATEEEELEKTRSERLSERESLERELRDLARDRQSADSDRGGAHA